jgi:hypothetical protein
VFVRFKKYRKPPPNDVSLLPAFKPHTHVYGRKWAQRWREHFGAQYGHMNVREPIALHEIVEKAISCPQQMVYVEAFNVFGVFAGPGWTIFGALPNGVFLTYRRVFSGPWGPKKGQKGRPIWRPR